MGLVLLFVISAAALVSGILLTAQALNSSISPSSDETATVTAATTTNETATAPSVNFTGPPFEFGMGWGMMGEMRGRGPCGFGFGPKNVDISSDYISNVTAVAKADTDVQNLLNSGYNITRVMPQIKMTIDANGNVALKATNATLLLTNGTTGRALVTVDLTNNKVTQIVTLTNTVINK